MWQFGIPLFALTLSKAARLLVESHVAAAERRAIATPMRREEFELAKTLCTGDGEVHLADFVVLNLLRQGKLKISTIGLLRAQFDLLDTDRSGVLTLSEALAQPPEPLPPGEKPTREVLRALAKERIRRDGTSAETPSARGRRERAAVLELKRKSDQELLRRFASSDTKQGSTDWRALRELIERAVME